MATRLDNVYAPPKSVVADAPLDDGALVKASRSTRLAAKLLDGLVIGIPLAPAYAWFARQFLHPGNGSLARAWAMLAGIQIWLYGGLLVGLGVAIWTAVLVQRNGQTIGKKLMDIKIVRADGSQATLTRIFWLRYLISSLLARVPGVGAVYALVDVLLIFGEARRCCHDYIADTVVVRA
jgi:uncharacterized RDD family membrane protein YckC